MLLTVLLYHLVDELNLSWYTRAFFNKIGSNFAFCLAKICHICRDPSSDEAWQEEGAVRVQAAGLFLQRVRQDDGVHLQILPHEGHTQH